MHLAVTSVMTSISTELKGVSLVHAKVSLQHGKRSLYFILYTYRPSALSVEMKAHRLHGYHWHKATIYITGKLKKSRCYRTNYIRELVTSSTIQSQYSFRICYPIKTAATPVAPARPPAVHPENKMVSSVSFDLPTLCEEMNCYTFICNVLEYLA